MTEANTRRMRGVSVAAALGGAALFAWSIRAAGLGAVLGGIRRLGIGFVAIWALGGLRCMLRTAAWRLCLEDMRLLPFGRAFAAYLAGGALGNVTPFGWLISEPSKIVLVRSDVAATASIPALAVENLFYTATVALMLCGGTAALLHVAPVPPVLANVSVAFVALVVVGVGGAAWIVFGRRRVATAIARRIGRRTDRVGEIEDRMFRFVDRHPRRAITVVSCEALFHASAVFEIWLALRLITGAAPPLMTAFVLEYVNRAITIVFQWVPMWLGVDEAGTGSVAAALGINPAAGVSLALARKGRVLLWTVAGFAFLCLPRRSAAREDGLGNKTASFRVGSKAGGVACQPGSSSPAAQVSWDARSRISLRRKATTSSS